MNKINLKFIIQNDLIDEGHECYSDLLSIINSESTITAANKLLEKLEKEINDLKKLIKENKKSEIRKKYIKDLDCSETTIKPLMPGLYYHDKTYIACFPKIFSGKQEELKSNPEKSKEYFSIIFSTIIKYLKEENNKNQNKSVPEYDDLSKEFFDNFYFPGIIDKILDSYTRHKLVFPLRKHENVNNWSNIDWNKTIARSSIFLIEDNDFPIFDKVISHNLNEDKEHIVAKIHAMILNEIFDEFGWLFWNRYIPFIPDLKETLLKEQTPYYLKILKEEISKTNIEWKKETINLLINYLEEKYLGSPNAKHWLASGDGVFNQIWQKACQVVYGNHLNDEISKHPIIKERAKNLKKLVEDIFKGSSDKNKEKEKENDKKNTNIQNTIPDQILIFDNKQKILIIDSKNYKEQKNIKIYKEVVYSFYFLDLLLNDNKYEINDKYKLNYLWRIKKDERKLRIFTCYFCPSVLEEGKFFEYSNHKKLDFSGADEKERNEIKYWDLQNLWFINVSIIKTFEHYLSEDNPIDLSDFDPEKEFLENESTKNKKSS